MLRVFCNFAALIRLVLRTPLADLFAKAKAGKLTAASNTVCHVLIKAYQQFALRDKKGEEKHWQ
ncbi:MAG: hypothetical protein WB562_17275 [Candidatus Sulfotelmatobacter sp.]